MILSITTKYELHKSSFDTGKLVLGTDSSILFLLFLKNVCKSLWIKASAKCPKCKLSCAESHPNRNNIFLSLAEMKANRASTVVSTGSQGSIV